MKKLLQTIGFLLTASIVSAALPAGGVWNCRTTATAGNLNGGGFNSARGGTDYTLQDSAQTSGSDGTSNASTTFTSATASFTSQMAGNYLHLTSGTNGTAGWYEIVSYTNSTTVTLDRNCSSGAMTDGVFKVGGALSLASTLDDDFFDSVVAGNIVYIKSGTYTLGEAVTPGTAGGAQSPIQVRGFTTTNSDWATTTGSNRPLLDTGANGIAPSTNWDFFSVNGTGTASHVLNLSSGSRVWNCKWTNTSTSAGRDATAGAGDVMWVNNEFISYRGMGILTGGNACYILGNWIHDSDGGISSATTTVQEFISDNVIESCVSYGIKFTGAATAQQVISNNTLFGSINTTGTGIQFATGCTDMRVINNIIAYFTTGLVNADVTTINFDWYNDYYGNDVDVAATVGGGSDTTRWPKGATSFATNPSFTSVGQVTGATATTTAGNHLVQSGATFQTSGVTAGRDYVYIVSGTGVTAGIYGIASVDSETQITTDITLAADATANKVFQITTGHNFAVSTALKATGAPAAFQGGYSTSYREPGAVQRQESSGQTSGASVR